MREGEWEGRREKKGEKKREKEKERKHMSIVIITLQILISVLKLVRLVRFQTSYIYQLIQHKTMAHFCVRKLRHSGKQLALTQ